MNKDTKLISKLKSWAKEASPKLVDPNTSVRVVSIGTFIILACVSMVMTVMNLITGKGALTVSTAVFAVLCVINYLLTFYGKKGVRIARTVFAVELLSLFTFFLISGNPDGFSAIWICLVPSIGLSFYGKKNGSIFCAVMLAVLLFFFYVPVGREVLHFDYGKTFMMRFPLLYCAFFALAFLLESLRAYGFSELVKLNKLQKEISIRDQLTGVYNRVGLYETLTQKIKTEKYDKIGIVISDLDFFKKVNDTYGHVAGDFVLKEFGEILSKDLNAIICRWGGEEFAMIYFNDDIKKNDLDTLRDKVANHTFIFDGNEIKLTVSLGAFETSSQDMSQLPQWIKNADAALYSAKENGRNKVVYY